ncbi:hypothetical protein [Metabacillus iocasae]|uniref:Flagellar hook-length control protein-like C-terminal domain-containing protein n=1 Tax=Priestia iocasae TaxID=2291674 RepID=A0ABS2QY91_9BACI|nr:hypothetical protein [Metabacillus iocasae]MBM7704455.1 hypothetical protein [Metabacillus iocasae]
MQIYNQLGAYANAASQSALMIKQGQQVTGTIQHVLNEFEGMMTVNGKLVRVKVDQPIEVNQKMTIDVTNVSEAGLEGNVVKQAVSQPIQSAEQSVDQLLTDVRNPRVREEVKGIVQALEQKGVSLKKEDIQKLITFVAQAKGTVEQKLATIEALLAKKLPITPELLTPIHEALHRQSMTEWIEAEQAPVVNDNPEIVSTVEEAVQNFLQEPITEADLAEGVHAPAVQQTQTSTVSKQMIVKVVTEQLARLTNEFAEGKRTVFKSVQALSEYVDPEKPVPEQAHKWLDAAIKKVDDLLLKSNMMLYADMKTEKQLLEVSTLLQQAKKHVTTGNVKEGATAIQHIKSLLETIEYKPSVNKMVHLVQGELPIAQKPNQASHAKMVTQQGERNELVAQRVSEKNQAPHVFSQVQRMVEETGEQASGRQVLEVLKKLGVGHEREVARSLFFQREAQPTSQQNVKEALLQLVQHSPNGKVPLQVEQALNHVTGQQLLSKPESGTNVQSLFFQLPYMLEDQIKSVNVYINSQKKQETIDWENCSLYFLFETNKLGPMGVLLTAVDRKLTLTFKSNDEQFAEKAKPLVEWLKENVQSVGFRIEGVNYQSLIQQSPPVVETEPEAIKPKTNQSTEEGFDFSI